MVQHSETLGRKRIALHACVSDTYMISMMPLPFGLSLELAVTLVAGAYYSSFFSRERAVGGLRRSMPLKEELRQADIPDSDDDDIDFVRDYFTFVDPCPLAEQCSHQSWGRVKKYSYVDCNEVRKSIKAHLMNSSLHQLTEEDAENLTVLMEVSITKESYEDRAAYRAQLRRQQKRKRDEEAPGTRSRSSAGGGGGGGGPIGSVGGGSNSSKGYSGGGGGGDNRHYSNSETKRALVALTDTVTNLTSVMSNIQASAGVPASAASRMSLTDGRTQPSTQPLTLLTDNGDKKAALLSLDATITRTMSSLENCVRVCIATGKQIREEYSVMNRARVEIRSLLDEM